MCKHFPLVSVARFVCESVWKSVAVACGDRSHCKFLCRAPFTLRHVNQHCTKEVGNFTGMQ